MKVYLPPTSQIVENSKVDALTKDSHTLGMIVGMMSNGKSLEEIKALLATKGYK